MAATRPVSTTRQPVRPGGPGHGPGSGFANIERAKNARSALKRLWSFVAESKQDLILVVLLVLVATGAAVMLPIIQGRAIDNYILKGDLPGLGRIALLYLGVLAVQSAASFGQQWIMPAISQRTIRLVRKRLFEHLQLLSLRYIDSKPHGELMSLYTNDTDAIREMLSNSVAQFIGSAITIVGVFTAMVIYSWRLTVIVVAMLFIIVKVIGAIGSRSGKGFMAQQKAIGAVNGYIEEMIDGQKVVKVFTHEDEACAEFDKLNEELCTAATRANTFANILMPVMNNLSYIHYAATAIAGGIMVAKGIGSMTVGTVVSYLQFTRQFSQPITQVSQQLNSVLTALAGAERIFRVIDEEPEEDNGYVTLVRAKEGPDGQLTETDERTGCWAWRHPHKADGTVTYTKVRGRVEFDDVYFGYEPEKTVLNGITLYAEPGQKIAFVGSTGAGKTTITNSSTGSMTS